MIDGQYKEDMKKALLELLQEGLTIFISNNASKSEDGQLIDVTTYVEIDFYGKTIATAHSST